MDNNNKRSVTWHPQLKASKESNPARKITQTNPSGKLRVIKQSGSDGDNISDQPPYCFLDDVFPGKSFILIRAIINFDLSNRIYID